MVPLPYCAHVPMATGQSPQSRKLPRDPRSAEARLLAVIVRHMSFKSAPVLPLQVAQRDARRAWVAVRVDAGGFGDGVGDRPGRR